MNTIMHLFSYTTLFMIEFLKGANIIYAGVVQGEMMPATSDCFCSQNSKLKTNDDNVWSLRTKH